jgi:hypothetical protein
MVSSDNLSGMDRIHYPGENHNLNNEKSLGDRIPHREALNKEAELLEPQLNTTPHLMMPRLELQAEEPAILSDVLSDSDLPAGVREYGVARRVALLASCKCKLIPRAFKL